MIAIEPFGIKQVIAGLDDVAKNQVPFALSLALNRTAQAVKSEIVKVMQSVFNRPTPYILNSLYIYAATKSNLTAEVLFKDQAQPMMIPQVEGGDRRMKRSEQWIGRYWVPGKGAKLNAYGNISAGMITQILSILHRTPDPYQWQTTKSKLKAQRIGKARDIFVLWHQKGHLRPGVYERVGKDKHVVCLLLFINMPHYSKRLPFYETGRGVTEQQFPTLFYLALAQAIGGR